MPRGEVARKFDEIVAFSGIEKHIDTPVKWYSSGMYVRLGFAVAAHLEPEILVVDEVLAVGDAEFQKRCLGRMGEVSHDGRTVLFVSHNMQAVRRLCERAMLLDHGRLVMEGDVESVAQHYLASVDAVDDGRRTWPDPERRPGDDLCRIVEVRVTDDSGEPAGSFFSSRPIHVVVEFDLTAVHPSFMVGIDVLTSDGIFVFTSYHRDVADDAVPEFSVGRNAVRCTIPPALLNSGRYSINLRVSLHNVRFVAMEESLLQFDVVADHGESSLLQAQARTGVILPVLDWTAVEPEAEAVEEPPAVRASVSG
jgi:lipopolysaccharide transport system ATP-binding protein